MNTANLDVTGIGNAIVDVLTEANDEFLQRSNLEKGAMTLIDSERALQLHSKMQNSVERSGGSAGNTIAGLASLGGSGAYIGKVKDDELGKVFAQDLKEAGIVFETPASRNAASTGRCLIFVTPDAQRTLCTYLGAAVELGPADVDPSIIARSQVTYLEGYLFDPPHAREAFVRAAQIAHDAQRKVALSLSDSFCVARYRQAFQELVADHIDLLFANETEILSLYETNDFDQAARTVRGKCELAVLTRSAKGSVVLKGHETFEVGAEKVAHVVDTTGAGDLYASGFLWGYTRGLAPARCAKAGAVAAAEVISHFGARPETDLKALMSANLG
ncbi:MAG TPA: adenosine kinase [Polyangiaceae bacterium]|nr:adenosine kinase [Polyangiaceae bacterium]